MRKTVLRAKVLTRWRGCLYVGTIQNKRIVLSQRTLLACTRGGEMFGRKSKRAQGEGRRVRVRSYEGVQVGKGKKKKDKGGNKAK